MNNTVLVCLSPSPSNIEVIQSAYQSLHKKDKFIAIYVSNHKQSLKEFEQRQLDKNMEFAKQLNADVEIIYADDTVNQIIQYANIYKVKKIVVGKSINKKRWYLKHSLSEQILEQDHNFEVLVVPTKAKIKIPKIDFQEKMSSHDSFISIFILMVCTLVGYFFFMMNFHDSNIIMVYILGVLLIALLTSSRVYSVLSTIASVLLFNFCFTFPTMSLSVYDSSYVMTFLIMIIVAFITSTLTSRIKQNASTSSNMAYISKILLETNQTLQQYSSEQDIVNAGCKILSELLKRNIIYYTVENNNLNQSIFISIDNKVDINEYLNPSEKGVAEWVAIHNKYAGASTRYLSNAKCLYYAIRKGENVHGVIGIDLNNERLDSLENRILLAILGEMALTLENIKNMQEKNEAIYTMKKEQLRSDLLRSISHDLRTPLTSIYGNSDILLNDNGQLSEEKRKILCADIYDDSLWLINLVENLLSITKIEDGKMKLKIEPQMIEDIVNEALKHVNREKKKYQINIDIKDDFLMADMDARLIIQVIINLVDNAIKYSPLGSIIDIVAYQKEEMIYMEVRDTGEGIPKEEKVKIFEKFYTLNNVLADSKKSIGLGLSLCKSIVEAHGGNIYVVDNYPKGSIFTFTLPATKITLNNGDPKLNLNFELKI